MLKAICDYPKRQSLNLGAGFLGTLAVNEHAWEFRDIGYPAAVFLSL
jgi:hypothetical protein